MADEVVSMALIWQGIDKFRTEIKSAISAIDRGFAQAKEKIQQTNSKLKETASKLGTLPNLLRAAGITYFATSFIKAANEQEQVVTQLNSALAKTGQYTDEASQELQKYASELQRTTIHGDEAIMSGMALMENIGKMSVGQIPAASKAAIGFADALGIDLQSAFQLVGRSAAGQNQLWTRYGVVLDMTKSKEEIFQQVMEMGNSHFQTSTALANTKAGSLKNLGNMIGDVKEKFGDIILEALQPFIAFLRLVINVLNALPGPVRTIILTVGLLAVAIKALGISFKTAFGPWGLIIQGAILVGVLLYKNWHTVTAYVGAALKTIGGYLSALWETIKILAKNIPTALKNMATMWVNYYQVIWEASKELGKRLWGVLGGIGKMLLGVFTLDADKIKEGFQESLSAVKDGWGDTIKHLMKTATEGLEKFDTEGIKEAWAAAGTQAGTAFKDASDQVQARKAAKALKNAPGATSEEEIETAGVATETGGESRVDREADIQRRIRELRIANIVDTYDRERSEAQIWYDDEISKAEGNAELIAEIDQQMWLKMDAVRASQDEAEIERTKALEDAKAGIRQDGLDQQYGQESQFLTDMQGAYEGWFMSLADQRQSAAERAEQLMDQVKNAAMRSAWGELKAFLFKEGVVKTESKKTTLVLVGEYAIRVAKGLASIAVEIAGAVAGAIRWVATKLGPLGFLAAPALIASGIALVAGLKKTFGFEKGGAIVGEKGPEIIAPVRQFADYSGQIASAVAKAVRESVGLNSSRAATPMNVTFEFKDARFMGTNTESVKKIWQDLKPAVELDLRKAMAKA